MKLADAPDFALAEAAAEPLAVLEDPADPDAAELDADEPELWVVDEPAVARPAVLPVVRDALVGTAPPMM